MVDVVLISPDYYKRSRKTRNQPQLGLAYIASYLEMQGVKVKVIDSVIDNLNSEQISERVKLLNPIMIGITGCTDDRFGIIETIKCVRNKCKDILIVAGGPHFSYTAEDALLNIPALDVVIIGEGEHAMYELVDIFSSNRNRFNFENIKGIAWRHKMDKIVRTAQREIIKDINVMPSPAWHLFEINKYNGIMSAGAPYRSIGVISSRGCPFSCSYCVNSLNKKVRYIKPARFVDDVEFLMNNYGFKALNFQDDSFTANEGHVIAICNEIMYRKINLKWYCSLRISQAFKNKELLHIMKESGCIALGFGIEFPSNEVLKKINKKVTTEEMEMAFKNVASVGFQYVNMFLMNSLPGQDRLNTIRAQLNINNFHKILYGRFPYSCYYGSLARLYPGTELTRLAEKQGNIFPKNFSWNRYYNNPMAVEHFWSMPTYENEMFPIRTINKTFKEIHSYFWIRKIIDLRKIKSLILFVIIPFRWRMLFNAINIWITLKISRCHE